MDLQNFYLEIIDQLLTKKLKDLRSRAIMQARDHLYLDEANSHIIYSKSIIDSGCNKASLIAQQLNKISFAKVYLSFLEQYQEQHTNLLSLFTKFLHCDSSGVVYSLRMNGSFTTIVILPQYYVN